MSGLTSGVTRIRTVWGPAPVARRRSARGARCRGGCRARRCRRPLRRAKRSSSSRLGVAVERDALRVEAAAQRAGRALRRRRRRSRSPPRRARGRRRCRGRPSTRTRPRSRWCARRTPSTNARARARRSSSTTTMYAGVPNSRASSTASQPPRVNRPRSSTVLPRGQTCESWLPGPFEGGSCQSERVGAPGTRTVTVEPPEGAGVTAASRTPCSCPPSICAAPSSILHGAGSSQGDRHSRLRTELSRRPASRRCPSTSAATVTATVRWTSARGGRRGDGRTARSGRARSAAVAQQPLPLGLRGSSMGGYLALVAAGMTRAVAVVAICPASADAAAPRVFARAGSRSRPTPSACSRVLREPPTRRSGRCARAPACCSCTPRATSPSRSPSSRELARGGARQPARDHPGRPPPLDPARRRAAGESAAVLRRALRDATAPDAGLRQPIGTAAGWHQRRPRPRRRNRWRRGSLR